MLKRSMRKRTGALGSAARTARRLAAFFAIASLPVSAQILDRDAVELADVLEIQLLGRDLLAYGGTGSGRMQIRLELGETLLHESARGRVGLASTIAARSACRRGAAGRRRATASPKREPTPVCWAIASRWS